MGFLSENQLDIKNIYFYVVKERLENKGIRNANKINQLALFYNPNHLLFSPFLADI